MDLMRVAGRIGRVSEDMWAERCEWLRSMTSTYFIVVITAPNMDGTDEKVVATGTVFFEHKFLHGLGVVGHIEDIAVARDQKGKKMGLRILEALTFAASERGCYKVGQKRGLQSITLTRILRLWLIAPRATKHFMRRPTSQRKAVRWSFTTYERRKRRSIHELVGLLASCEVFLVIGDVIIDSNWRVVSSENVQFSRSWRLATGE
jgi:hypothetical protein